MLWDIYWWLMEEKKYGNDFWKNVTHDAAAYKGLFYPFQKAIKKYSGIRYIEFRNDGLNYFKNKLGLKSEKQISVSDKKFINEEYPALTEDNSIIYVKTSFKKIHSFTISNGTTEKKIRIKDVSLDNHFSYRKGKIVYASYQPDKRWGYRDFSDLQILDLKTGTQKSLTHHTKYFAPDINDNGTKVVAVEVIAGGGSSLHLIDAGSGRVINSIPNSENLFYTYPKFYGDKIISAVRNTSGHMSLASINSIDGKTEFLTPFFLQCNRFSISI